ncbi:MAG TPA: hypothetical protein VN688_32330 [Gemmataceae bacterium]|nr:hypothetical protein [Gemmataceae bacterium]
MRRFALLPALGLALGVVGLGQADPPNMQAPNAASQPATGLSNLIEPASEPDINAAFAVTPEAGAWMICAASYQGPDAPELANKLCEYLRSHRYPAYVYNRGNEERKQLQEELTRWQKEHPTTVRKWKLAHPKEEQLAVLIGGFRDVDAASAELKKVRKLDIPNFKLKSGKPACDTYDVYEQTTGTKNYELKRYAINPFHTAFAIRNPTIQHVKQVAAKVDPLWKKLNADEPRSLFKCRKPWTLAVQEYAGTQVIQPTAASSGFLEKLGFGDHNLGKRLDASALQAQQVCDFLAKFGYKTYVLHTRTNSVVTVGEFNGINDPELLRIQKELSRFSFKDKEGHEVVKLFAKPLPMEVPH